MQDKSTDDPCAGHECDHCAICRKGRCCRRDNPHYELPEEGGWPGPIIGALGVLRDDGDKVECHMCGAWFGNLGNHAWRTHDVTPDEYRALFGLRATHGLVGPTCLAKHRAPENIERLARARPAEGNNIVDALGEREDNGLADVLEFFFPEGGGLVMAVAAYFDESFESGDERAPICVAGYIFRRRAYKRFVRDWRAKVLKIDGRDIAPFHMKDLVAGKKAYDGLAVADRVRVLGAAVDVVAEHAFGGIVVHFDRAEFVAVARPDWVRALGSIYTQTCILCLHVTALWLKQRRCAEPVLYVFERGHKWQHETDEKLADISRDEATRDLLRFHDHHFVDKDRECGLQAADLLAWTVRKHFSDAGFGGRTFVRFAEPLDRLGKRTKKRTHIASFTGDRLRAYLTARVTGRPTLVFSQPGPRTPGWD